MLTLNGLIGGGILGLGLVAGEETPPLMAPFLNVRDFGARPMEFGDSAKVAAGVDSTAAFQAALDAAKPGGMVFVPTGCYAEGRKK